MSCGSFNFGFYCFDLSKRMGKYMKKTRGAGGRMDAMRQEQLGVRTRARAQAIEKIMDTTTHTTSSSNNKLSSGTLTTFAPAKISYLELRSRRLEKTVGYADKLPFTQKAASSYECPRLSDLTNSDILADDSSSWLAVPSGKARCTRRQTRHGGSDENEQLSCGFHDLAGASFLHGSIVPLQQWGTRGKAPLGVAHSRSNSRSNSVTPPSVANSRSNSRSNSVTRELPTPTGELASRGILTRNQRKKENQCSHTTTRGNGVADIGMEVGTFCHASGVPALRNVNSCHARNLDLEVGIGKQPLDQSSLVRDRISCDGIPVSNAAEGSMSSFSAKLLSELVCHNVQAAPSNAVSPLDMEIEDFFLQAEKQQQRRFIEQYNFDPVNDTPLSGRYNWVRL